MPPVQKRSVLVLEHDDAARRLICSAFAPTEFTVSAATLTDVTASALGGLHPDVAVIDLEMPGLDGVGLTRRIRAAGDSYIIVTTARASELDALRSLDNGADAFLRKPLRPQVFGARVAAILQRPHITRPGSRIAAGR